MSLPIKETYKGCTIIQSQDRKFIDGFWFTELRVKIKGEVFIYEFKCADEPSKRVALNLARKEIDDFVQDVEKPVILAERVKVKKAPHKPQEKPRRAKFTLTVPTTGQDD